MKLNRNQLKYIAIVAMLIDHIAWTFVPLYTVLGQVLQFIGRLTGPIMAYMIYEGYVHTRSIKKYVLRMGIFALISWVPFSLHEAHRFPTASFGVIFTLFLALLTLWMWDKANIPQPIKIALVIAACGLSLLGDWPIFDIMWPLFLLIDRGDPKKQWKDFIIITIAEVVGAQFSAIGTGQPFRQVFQFGAFLVPPVLMYLYNGEPGSKKAFHKWFFYIFYPVHLLALALIDMYLV